MSFNIFKSTLEGLQKLSGTLEKTASPIQRILNIQKTKQKPTITNNIIDIIGTIQKAKKTAPVVLSNAQKLSNDIRTVKPYISKGIQKLQTPQARAMESVVNVLGIPTNFTGRTNFDQIKTKPLPTKGQQFISKIADVTAPATRMNQNILRGVGSFISDSASPRSVIGMVSGKYNDANKIEQDYYNKIFNNEEIPKELQNQYTDMQGQMIAGLIDPSHGIKNVAGKVGKKLVDNISDDLVQEAKKYKSVEEFVKAQGTPVYRGKRGELSSGEFGMSTSRDKNVAEMFAQNRGVEELIISPKAKVLDSSLFSKGEKSINGKEILEFAKKNGYDAIDYSSDKRLFGQLGFPKGEQEINIINKDILKTKSQLTDIWNNANKPSPQALPIFNQVAKKSSVNESLSKKLASNIRTDKLGITGDSAQSELKRILDDADNFSSQRRGVQTFEMTEEAADKILPKIKLKPGTTLNAEEKFALGNLVKGYSDEIDNLAQRIKSGENNDENLLQLAKLRTSYQTALASLSGAKAEAGRALSAERMINKLLVDPRIRQDEKMLKEALKMSGGREGVKQIAKRLGEFGDDTIAKYKFIQNISKPNALTKGTHFIDWYYYNSLLSGPKTQIRNILGNTFHIGFNLASKPFAGAIDATKSGAYRLAGKNRVREVYAGELPSEIKGMITGIPEAYRKARFMMKNGFSLDDMVESEFAKPEMFSKVFGGKLAGPANIVSRSMQSTDQFFRTVVANSELHSLAYKNAKNKGLKGDSYKKAVNEYIDNPPIEAIEAMRKAAETATFQNSNKVASGIDKLVKNIELEDGTEIFNPLKLIIPFVKTPTNIVARSAEATPLGLLTGALRTSGRESSQVMGKALLGSIGLASLWTLAQQGAITGSGPKNKEMRDALYATGWRPNSVKIGDKYYSFQLFAPLAQGLSVIGNANDQNMYEGVQPSVSNILFGVGNSLTQNSFLEGLDQLNQAIQYQDASYITKNVAGAAVPFSALLRTIAIGKDNKIREAGSLLDSMKANIPGLREDIPVKKDIFGRDLQYEGGALRRMLDPFNTSSVKTDRESELANETLRLGVKIQSPENKQKLTNLKTSEKIQLDSEQKNQYSQQLGEMMRTVLDRSISSPEYQQMTDDEKRVYLEERIEDGKKYVDGIFFINSLSPEQKKELGDKVVDYSIAVPSETKDIEAYDTTTGNKIDLSPEERSKFYERTWLGIYDAVKDGEQRKEFPILDQERKSGFINNQVSNMKSFMRDGFSILLSEGDEKFDHAMQLKLQTDGDSYLKNALIDVGVEKVIDFAKNSNEPVDKFFTTPEMKMILQKVQTDEDMSRLVSGVRESILSESRTNYENFLANQTTETKALFLYNEIQNISKDKKALGDFINTMPQYTKAGILDDNTINRMLELMRTDAIKKEEEAVNKAVDDGKSMWPTPARTVTQPYGYGHTGLDIGGKLGDPVQSALPGTVVSAQWGGPYGNFVVVDHGDGLVTRYAHLDSFAVKTGDQVSKGDLLGAQGSTGNSSGPHLHFEVMKNGQFVNPYDLQF